MALRAASQAAPTSNGINHTPPTRAHFILLLRQSQAMCTRLTPASFARLAAVYPAGWAFCLSVIISFYFTFEKLSSIKNLNPRNLVTCAGRFHPGTESEGSLQLCISAILPPTYPHIVRAIGDSVRISQRNSVPHSSSRAAFIAASRTRKPALLLPVAPLSQRAHVEQELRDIGQLPHCRAFRCCHRRSKMVY